MSLDSLNRSSILAGIAAASAAATASAATEIETESPRLLELADGLPSLVAALVKARDNKRAIYRAAMKDWPDVPEPLVSIPPKGFQGRYDHDRNVECGARNCPENPKS